MNYYELNGDAVFRNFWSVYLEYAYHAPFQDNRETRDGAILDRPARWHVGVWVGSDNRKKVFGGVWALLQRRPRGFSIDGELTLSLRPIPALEIDLLGKLNGTWGDPRWFETVDNGSSRTYLFGDLESRYVDITLRGTYTFTPRLTLQAYAQLFLASGHYDLFTAAVGVGSRAPLPETAFYSVPPPTTNPDFRSGAINANVVLRWEWRPGSTLILVYTHSQMQTPFDVREGLGRLTLTPLGTGPAIDIFLLKLTALWG
jgi:hypothetical protein